MALRLPPFLSALPWWAWLVGAGAFGVGVFGGLGGAQAMTPPKPGGAPPQGGPPPGAPPVLKLGSNGPWVRYLQKLLKLPETGTFDAQLRAAVVTYQKSKGLEADGVVGKNTWTSLGVTGAAAPSTPKPGGGSPSAEPPGGFLGSAGSIQLSDDIKAREQQILSAVAAGDVDHQWTPIQWQQDGHVVKMDVSRRALAITDGAGGRLIVNASMPTQQKIGDSLGGALLTTKMSDKIQELADITIPPLTRPWSQDGTMAKTARMVEQSAALDAKIADDGVSLVANEGKDWVLTRRWWPFPQGTNDKPGAAEGVSGSPHNAANFGWYPGGSKSPGGASVVQSVGLAHDKSHTDYSQLLRYVRKGSLTIDGAPADLEAALADPATSALLQDEGGTLPGIKHPDLEGVA